MAFLRFAQRPWRFEHVERGTVIDGLIRAEMGSEPLSILDCSAGIGARAIGLALLGHEMTARRTELSEILQREGVFGTWSGTCPITAVTTSPSSRPASEGKGLDPATSRMLTVATYNTHREKRGRDPALDALLREEQTLACLQEVSLMRALKIKRTLGSRAFISFTKHGFQYLVLVLPEDVRFVERRTAQLNGYGGLIPRLWSLRRGYALYRAGRRGWINCLEPRVAQTASVMWRGRTFRVVHTHLPFKALLRNPCLFSLQELVGTGNVLLVGDLNATTRDPFLADFLMATGLQPAGVETATHDGGRRIDYVLYRGGFREVGYAVMRSLSDHRVVRVELEV